MFAGSLASAGARVDRAGRIAPLVPARLREGLASLKRFLVPALLLFTFLIPVIFYSSATGSISASWC